ncbi:NADH-quinone oxidoreductase subunit L [Streptomyces sp. NPDC059002]|uniref:NADH-quinone oxidoreductase subunit 5 family protein n=1 Tax=Streptomyces sp. NPDC059002 TaxID=3346690 RepID=UPI0036955DC8
MTTTTLAVLVPLLPFLGAAAGLLLGRRVPGLVRPLAVLPTLTALVLAVLVAVRQGGGTGGGTAPLDAATELTPTGSVPIELALHIDGFAALVAVLVGVVASCVQIYSTGYLRDDPRYPSYAALVSLFTSAMLLVVYSGDLMVLLVGWEIMGICSYFLVGHYWETPEARAASLKAFLVTKLGDVPFLIGLFALAVDTGSFRITTILTTVADGGLDHPTLIALLLLAGVAGKSAQFPLHTWLPDAMAGPTPVSALIHAATMVAAGVYFVARLLPVFAASAAALVVLAVMAAVTMGGSALAALAQDDIKRVLAYSTIGQLGYMTGALAVGDRGAAVFHLLSHGAFKALLFLAAGVIIHAAGTNSLAAMSRMKGLRDRIPDAYWTMTVALLALAAIPPFSGFFSKEAVLGAAEHTATGHAESAPTAAGWIVLVAGLLTALLTAAYATRLWLLAFHGKGAEAPDHGKQPVTMTAVLWVLAVPSLVFGLAVGVLPDWFDGHELTPTLTTSVLGTGLALVGALVTYGAWRHTTALAARVPMGAARPSPDHRPSTSRSAAHLPDASPDGDGGLVEAEAIATHTPAYGDVASAPDPADPGRLLLGPLHRHAAVGFHLDAVYAALFVRPVQAAARLVRFLDREVVETYVRGAGAAPRWLGAAVRRAQTGNVQTYLSALLAGAVVLAVAAVLVATAGA